MNMWPVVLLAIIGTTHGYFNDTVENQLIVFKKRTSGSIGVLTTSTGAPVEVRDTETINSELLRDEFFLDDITHITRERIPERVVHAKGAGAFGYFEVTHDLKQICSAKLFNALGKKTPVVVRFSPIFQGSGGSDTDRGTRGFATKFYTEDGNLDIIATDVDIFTFKDPVIFSSFVHAFTRNPRTHIMPDANMVWDFLTLRPESFHTMLLVWGDLGITDGYRYMPGFPIHTFELVNDHAERTFVRFHILPDAGIKTLTSAEGTRLAGEDPDYATKDLYNAIAIGDYPTWTLSVQIMTPHDVKTAKFDPFDVTKRWPVDHYPLRPVGRLVLNENPINYFAQVEQLAYSPANLVPGILGGNDKLFESRILAYREAQYYRLGTNFHKIDVNCPLRAKTLTYNRDGVPPLKDNEKDAPNYYPNSFHGPMPYLNKKRLEITKVYTDPAANNFDQAAEVYRSMSRGERKRLVANVFASLKGAAGFLQERAVKIFKIIDEDLSERVATALKTNGTSTNNHYYYNFNDKMD